MNSEGLKPSRHFDIFKDGVNLRHSFLLLVFAHQLLFHTRGVFLEVLRQAAFDAGDQFGEKIMKKVSTSLAHSCTRFPCYLGMESMQRPNEQQQRLSSWAINYFCLGHNMPSNQDISNHSLTVLAMTCMPD